MGITVKRTKNERGVLLGDLNLGDTFMYDNRLGMVVEINGHLTAIELPKGITFRREKQKEYQRTLPKTLDTGTLVLPVDCELTYKVMG